MLYQFLLFASFLYYQPFILFSRSLFMDSFQFDSTSHHACIHILFYVIFKVIYLIIDILQVLSSYSSLFSAHSSCIISNLKVIFYYLSNSLIHNFSIYITCIYVTKIISNAFCYFFSLKYEISIRKMKLTLMYFLIITVLKHRVKIVTFSSKHRRKKYRNLQFRIRNIQGLEQNCI